jgi:hypothetical protein
MDGLQLKKRMKRYATKIPLEEFKGICKSKLGLAYEFDGYDLPEVIEKDLAKLNFDRENFSFDEGFSGYPCGFEVLENGLPVLFVNSGGDWEFPICFCIYWDGSTLRAYIPKDGNVYNVKEKCAYGSEEDMEAYEDSEFFKERPEPSPSKIRRDIINRIVLK